ncbi:MAG: APC family permease [Lachnospiraceae bacterium]|nr:APC family permease [Lachnospiraceae bacterium]
MEERHGYQNNESYGGQNPGEMREGQEGMYGQGPSGGEAVPAERIGNKPKWVIGRTVLGILSIILFIFVAMQSCAAGLGNALSDNGEVGGSAGALCALNLLVAGLIVLVARKTVKKAPMIVAAVLMFLNLFYGMILAGSYADLQIWGVLSFIFGLVYLFSVLRKKKQWIIAGIISAVFFALVMAMGSASSGSSGTGNSGSGEAPAETSQAPADNGGKAVAGTGIDKEQTMNTGSVSETGAVQEQTGQGSGLQEAEQTRQQGAPARQAAEQQRTPVEQEAGQQGAPAGQAAGQQGAPAGQNAGAAWEVGQGRVLTYTDSINTTWAQVSVPVTNTGDRNLYLSSGTMDLEDAGGHLVDSLSLVGFYPQVLAPGETGWYYEETTLDSVPSSELTVVPHVDIKEATVECIRYEASDLSFADEEFGGIKATGRITNTTAADGSLVYVVLFLFDSEEKLVGQTFTILDDELKAGDTIGFSTQTFGSNDTINVDTITGYRLFAYPEQFQF